MCPLRPQLEESLAIHGFSRNPQLTQQQCMKISLRNFTQICSEQWKIQMNFRVGQHIMTTNSLIAITL